MRGRSNGRFTATRRLLGAKRRLIFFLSALSVCVPGIAQTPATQSDASDPLSPIGRWTAYQGGSAQLPPMGWNSWNAFATEIDEEKLLGSARRILGSGLAEKGYRYIDIDDGWWLKRRTSDGRLMIRADKFPSARTAKGDPSFRPLTDRLHGWGFKAGIYSDLGRNSCSQAYSDGPQIPEGAVAEREVGLYGHSDQDIRLFFADWGFDAIKVDGCGIRAFSPNAKRVRSGQYRALQPLIDQQSITRSNIPAVKDNRVRNFASPRREMWPS